MAGWYNFIIKPSYKIVMVLNGIFCKVYGDFLDWLYIKNEKKLLKIKTLLLDNAIRIHEYGLDKINDPKESLLRFHNESCRREYIPFKKKNRYLFTIPSSSTKSNSIHLNSDCNRGKSPVSEGFVFSPFSVILFPDNFWSRLTNQKLVPECQWNF